MPPARLGGRVRALRRQQSLTQAAMAEQLGISAAYLNLIEHDRRPLTATLLINLARVFHVDLASFAVDDEARMASDLVEVFGDPLFEGHPLGAEEVRDLASQAPQAARAVLTLYRALTEARARLEASPSPTAEFTPDSSLLPSEEVGDFIQRRLNHFPELEEAAEELWRRCRLDADDVFYGLRRHLTDVLGVQLERSRLGGGVVRRYDPDRRVLSLSTALPPRTQTFALAHQVARLQYGDVLGRLSDDRGLTSEGSRALCRVALANYFAAAVMMPYTSFLDAATTLRYDIELLGHRFRSSFEQVCHRLTTLQRPGAEGVPFHLIRVDIAGNISKRFSASGIRFARFAGACPRWNVHTAFLTPGLIRTQLSRMTDGKVYFCVARTVRDDAGGYNAQHAIHAIAMGLEVSHARKLVYTDGIDLENLDTAVAIGTTCRQCDRVDCAQRAFPPVEHPLRIDENVRGVSFFAPVR